MWFQLKKVIAVGLSVLVLVAIFANVNLSATFNSIRSIDAGTLVLCLALITLNLLVVAFRLQRIMHHFGSRLTFFVSFHASLSGLVASLFLINVVGAVLGRQVVLRTVGVSAALSTFISGYERLILGVIGGILAVWGGIYLVGGHVLNDLFHGLPIVPIAIALVLVSLAVLFTSRSSFERDILRRLASPRRILEVSEIVAISGASQLVNMCIYTILIASLGMDLPVWKVMAASAMVSFAASVPISVNGWGVREISSIYAFGLLGVDAASATAVSIAVGLLNTLVVVIAAPGLAVSRRIFTARLARLQTLPARESNASFSDIHAQDQLDFLKISSFSLGIMLSIFIYFQFPVIISGTTVTLNLGDIFALLGVGLVASQLAFGGALNFHIGRPVLIWLALVTLAIYLSLLIGIIHYGVIPWAIGNRGIGWLVVIGYFSSGALFTGQFGRQGVRRLAQVLLLTAAVVTAVHLLHRIAFVLDWTSLPPSPNFEAFSANRNAFAFQLLVTLGFAACYLLPIRTINLKSLVPVMALVFFAVIATNSLTSYVSLAVFAIILATGRRQLVARFAVVALLGAALYAGMPYLIDVLRAAQPLAFSLSARVLNAVAELFSGHGVVLTTEGGAAGHAAPVELFQELPIERLTGQEDSSVTERLESLRGGLALFREHPFFGAGLGAFISTQISKTGTALIIHSTYVWIIAEMGLLGLLLMGSVPVMQIRRVWNGWWRRPKRMLGGLGKNDSALLMLVAMFCVFSLAHEIAYQRIFWFVLGALLASPGRVSIRSLLPERLSRQRPAPALPVAREAGA